MSTDKKDALRLARSGSKRRAILEAAYAVFRSRGFDKGSIDEITERVGGSKATIYSHFGSKEELFVECTMAALEDYMSGTLRHLQPSHPDPATALREFGASVLEIVCSLEQIEVRRLMIAEAARSGTGRLFFEKIVSLRARLAEFLAACMRLGCLRRDDPVLAAGHFGALLETELLEPMLLRVREQPPSREETAGAAARAVAAFLRAYAPDAQPASGSAPGLRWRGASVD